MEEIIARKFQTLQLEWNERQRRLWAASEAMCLGHGGISIVGRATGLSRPTILKGIKELKNNKRLAENRVRCEGAGRKKTTQKQPDLLPTLDAIVEPTAKGDPMSPLRWTTHSPRHLSRELNEQGFEISPRQAADCCMSWTINWLPIASRSKAERILIATRSSSSSTHKPQNF